MWGSTLADIAGSVSVSVHTDSPTVLLAPLADDVLRSVALVEMWRKDVGVFSRSDTRRFVHVGLDICDDWGLCRDEEVYEA